jgi:hypothetical protein
MAGQGADYGARHGMQSLLKPQFHNGFPTRPSRSPPLTVTYTHNGRPRGILDTVTMSKASGIVHPPCRVARRP